MLEPSALGERYGKGFTMATPNQLLQWQRGVDKALYVLQNKLGYAGNVDMQIVTPKDYEDPKHGSQVIVRKPMRFIATSGDSPPIQGMTEETVVVTVQPPINIMVSPQGAEIPLILDAKRQDEWVERVATPMMGQLATKIDAALGSAAALSVANFVGTPGTAPSTLSNILAGTIRLNQLGVPEEDRVLILGPEAHGAVMAGLSGNFVQRVIDAAEMRNDLDFPIAGYNKILMSQNTPARTVGTYHAGGVVNGPGQQGSVLLSNGWTSGDTLNQGDVITIGTSSAGVNLINPQTRVSRGVLQPFVVQAPCAADVNGNMNPAAGGSGIPIYPPINPPVGGQQTQFQTVDSFPSSGAAITVLTGSSGVVYQENLALQKQALGFVSIKQPEYLAAEYCKTAEYKGISMRMWLGPDITNNRQVFRIDILPAFPVYRQESAVRITS